MSLFDNPGESSPLPKSSLFDNEPDSSKKTSNNLFDSSAKDGSASQWSLPAPKKASRGEMIKSLLPSNDVPDAYIEVFDTLLDSRYRAKNGATIEGIKQVLGDAGLDEAHREKILSVVLPGGEEQNDGVGRGEFNVFMALIGLAQEGDAFSLDEVDERRRNLPVPKLEGNYAKDKRQDNASEDTSSSPATTKSNVRTPKPKTSQRGSYSSFPESDPWGSPDLHKGHNHVQEASNYPAANQNGAQGLNTGSRGSSSGGQRAQVSDSTQPAQDSPRNTWATPHDALAPAFRDSGIADADYGDDASANTGGRARVGQNLGADRSLSQNNEVITIEMLPEKEGMFMFQHRNYQVSSAKRNSTVIRRYSDFVWLLDCLHKRYPFRQLPLLPPKRVAINGNHLAADNHFLEKRRKGLVRFTNALVRHPVLSQEQLVIMFLTVPTELAVWRKQATVSVQEEFTGKTLPADLEESLPPSLQETFDTVRSGVKRSAEMYITLCNLLERLHRRNEGLAADHRRISDGLQNIAAASKDTYAIDTNDVPLLNVGLEATAKHMFASQGLLEDEARAWEEGVIEDAKRQRDCLVSVRDMFDRRDRYDKDNIPQLEKRISANESKLFAISSKPEPKPGEAEKVQEAIAKDKQSIIDQHARSVFVKECIRDEILFFQQSQYHVSKLHQEWSQERVKYAELQADNWRALVDEVEVMPLGD